MVNRRVLRVGALAGAAIGLVVPALLFGLALLLSPHLMVRTRSNLQT